MTNVWMYIGIFSTVFACVLLFFTLWRRREVRRYRAVKLAAEMDKWGIGDTFGRLFMAYAVGNYLGKDSVTRVIHELIRKIKTDGMPVTMGKLFWKLAIHFAKDANNREKLLGIVNDGAAKDTRSFVEDPDIDDTDEDDDE